MEEEEKKWQQLHFIPNWFSVDVKTGVCLTTCTTICIISLAVTNVDADDTIGGI